jgi:deoxyribonuclease V
MVIAALDAHYDEDASTGTRGAVVFEHWDDGEPIAEYTAECSGVEPYVPGQFFKRELPCLLAVLEILREPLNAIVIDGYVNMGEKPRLGMNLWEALDKKIPIIRVAKTRFHSADAVEIN